MRSRTLMWIGIAGLMLCAVGQTGWAEYTTDETISQAFLRKSHRVMGRLRGTLHAVLDGFLTGDDEVIRERAREIGKSMLPVSKELPPESGQESEEWAALAAIVEQAKLLEQRAEAGDHKAAYAHYTQLMQHCIACHQVRRSWGTFSASKPGAKEPPGAPEAQ